MGAENDALSEHLKELKTPVRGRSDSLGRVKEASQALTDDPLSRLTGALRTCDLRGLDVGSLSNSPSGSHGNSTGASPSISPIPSPRRRGQRLKHVQKTLEYFENGDLELGRKSLFDSKLAFIGALFEAGDEDDWTELSENLVVVFEKNHKSIRLMIWALRREVAGTLHEHDMFRLDSAASKLLGAYGQLIGSAYLKDMLKTLVKKSLTIVAKSEKDKDKEEIPDKAVWKLISSLMELLVGKMSSAPFPLRVLCFYIKEEMEKRFPGKGNIGVGGFVFLRLICPAIVAPEVRGICRNEISAPHRRFLVRVARELQQLVNIANRGETLSSEMYGTTTEKITFVGLNLQRIKTFLDGVGSKTLEEEKPSTMSPLKKGTTTVDLGRQLGGAEEEMALQFIVKFCELHREKLLNT